MKLEALLNSLMLSDTNSLGLTDIVLAICLPFFLSFFIVSVYRTTQRHNNYSVAFVHAIFLFSSLTSVVTLIIGSNIARAFGLIGALSIIRFRNALKSPLDAVYIFWALVVGMACGTGFYLAAILLTLICGFLMLLLHYSGYGETKYSESIVRVEVEDGHPEDLIKNLESSLAQHAKRYKQINVLFDSEKKKKTYVYLLTTKRQVDSKRFRKEIESVPGVMGLHHLNSEPSLCIV